MIDYMIAQNKVWYKAPELIKLFGRDALNKAYLDKLIEVRHGINTKVVRLVL